jgi:hypothetical protein
LVSLPRLRNQLVASRERLAREEAKAVERVDMLRSIMDDMSNELAQSDPRQIAALIVRAGDAARAGVPPKLPPKGSNENVTDSCPSKGERNPQDDLDIVSLA